MLLLLALACTQKSEDSDANPDPIGPRGDCNPVDDRACSFPFPSSFYLDEDETTGSGYRVAFGEGSLPVDRFGVGMRPDAWNRRDGFSTVAPLYTSLPDADVFSPGSLSFQNLGDYFNDDVTTVIVDTVTGERVPHYIEREAFAELAGQAALVLRPIAPLEHSRRYVVGIRNLVDAAGALVESPSAFADIRGWSENPDDDVRRQLAHYDDVIFPTLQATGFERADLQMAWDFVTVSAESSLAEMVWLRDDALAQVPSTGPDYTISSVAEYGCAEAETVGRRITGTLTVPFYLTADEPGVFLNRDSDGVITQNGSAEVPFTVIVPCSVLRNPQPSPLIQAGHGLFGQHTDIAGGTFTEVADAAKAVMFATSWRGLSGDDYTSVALMMSEDPSDFSIIPDGLMQAHVEAMLMARLMQGDLANDAALKVDGVALVDNAKVDFYGVSLGSVLGGAQVAMSPEIDRAAMQISGMPFSGLLTRSAAFSTFLALLGAKYDDAANISLIVPLAQMLWDPAETGGWAHFLADGTEMGGVADRRFLFQVGIGDDTVTSLGGHYYARAVGAGLLDTAPREVFGLEAVADTTQGSGLLEWDYGFEESLAPEPQNMEDNPHYFVPSEPGAQAQIVNFFATGDLASQCDGVCEAGD